METKSIQIQQWTETTGTPGTEERETQQTNGV